MRLVEGKCSLIFTICFLLNQRNLFFCLGDGVIKYNSNILFTLLFYTYWLCLAEHLYFFLVGFYLHW